MSTTTTNPANGAENPPSDVRMDLRGTSPRFYIANDTEKRAPNSEEVSSSGGPGTLPDDHYDGTLAWWRSGLRRRLVKNLKAESRWIAAMQNHIRTPWLDLYFVYTSSLGTHTFFMTALPALFFFGHAELGHGLIFVLGMGVYCSSFIKDAICSPRPYSPPVSRLTMGSHHLEYGFPSTHSTNSVSIALYIYSYIRAAYIAESISQNTYTLSCILLAWYAFSIVFGRLYTAMHSFTDCAVGVMLGAAIWAVHMVWRQALVSWVTQPSLSVPITVTAIGLVMVNQHPQPVDDCPCFEDAIAFVSVIMGSLLAQWHGAQAGFGAEFFARRMPGTDGADWTALSTWWLFAAVKMIVGVLVIFTWRLLAKSILHAVLPPTFRLLAQAFTLPNRRFYTPATDYSFVPPEKGLHPIPSVIDLPSHMGVDSDASGFSLARNNPYRMLKARNGYGNGDGNGLGRATSGSVGPELEKDNASADQDGDTSGPVKHYDADVLTKVLVYNGIAILATEWVPVMFEVLGWGVRP